MILSDQFISHNLADALFLYDPRKITLNDFTNVLLSGASVIKMLQVRAHAMLLFPVVWQRAEVWSYRGFRWFIVYTRCHYNGWLLQNFKGTHSHAHRCTCMQLAELLSFTSCLVFHMGIFVNCICLVCIFVILCVFVVSYVYLLCLICICCILCVFVVPYMYLLSLYVFLVSFVYLLCLICIFCILCAFVVICVYCCSYFRCRTAG